MKKYTIELEMPLPNSDGVNMTMNLPTAENGAMESVDLSEAMDSYQHWTKYFRGRIKLVEWTPRTMDV